MFTGLIEERGRVAVDPRPSGKGGVRLAIELGAGLAARLSLGASLAVSGVCLTVVELGPVPAGEEPEGAARGGSWEVVVEVAPETLARTTLGALRGGAAVNLEAALRAGDPLGGHLVQGHVDGTTAVTGRREMGEHRWIELATPPALAPFLVEKGSVCLDGVSLTVAALTTDASAGRLADGFAVTLIPHTLSVTTLGALQPGDRVNVEVDVLAKYVQRMLAARGLAEEPSGSASA